MIGKRRKRRERERGGGDPHGGIKGDTHNQHRRAGFNHRHCPGSIIDNAQSLELTTQLAGQVAGAATIFLIDEVWRVNGQEKTLLPASDQSKVYSGDCYIFQYSYMEKEDRGSAISQASKMVESLKFLPVQARIYEGKLLPFQFFSVFQSFIVFKGGLSAGYKKYIAEKELPDETYTEDGTALFRIQGSGPKNMQAI